MKRLFKKLTNLIDQSLKRLRKNNLCPEYTKEQIEKSLFFDFDKDIVSSCIALKLKIYPNDILGNISLKESESFIKECVIQNNYLFFYISKNYKKSRYNDVFQRMLCVNYGQCENKNKIVSIDYKSDVDKNYLSYFREQTYINALKNIYQTCGYQIVFNSYNISLKDSISILIKINDYIKEDKNTISLIGLNKNLIVNNTFSKDANYFLSYLNQFDKKYDKIISFRGKGYNVDYLKILKKQYNLQSDIIQTEPFHIKEKNSFNIKNDIENKQLLKYSFIQYNINRHYKFDKKNIHLPFIMKTINNINNIFLKMIKLNNYSIYIPVYTDWQLNASEIKICNYIINYELILEKVLEKNNIAILENYLFNLCHLSGELIVRTSHQLNKALAKKYIDKSVLNQKLRVLKMVQYVILHILDLFEISLKE